MTLVITERFSRPRWLDVTVDGLNSEYAVCPMQVLLGESLLGRVTVVGLRLDCMSKSATGRNLAISGIVCQLGPMFGLATSMIGMLRAFNELGSTGIGDPSHLSQAIGQTLMGTMLGMLVGLVGVVLLIVSVTACRYRAEWFFWFLVIYGALALTVFPIGTPFGIFFLVYCLNKRDEFLNRSQITSQPGATSDPAAPESQSLPPLRSREHLPPSLRS